MLPTFVEILKFLAGYVADRPGSIQRIERVLHQGLVTATGRNLFAERFTPLNNLSKGRGIGFFEADNFHPDFILWLLAGGRQHVIFVDPKGIRHLGATAPKIQFHTTIKDIEQRLGDPTVRLQSFIVSNTPSHTMRKLWSMEKSEMQKRHVLFQEEDKDSYVRSMLLVPDEVESPP